jgi:hypothetical protein
LITSSIFVGKSADRQKSGGRAGAARQLSREDDLETSTVPATATPQISPERLMQFTFGFALVNKGDCNDSRSQ